MNAKNSRGKGIPVIDIAPYLHGSEPEKRDVANRLAVACREAGFFCITGHGVNEGLISQTRQAGANFFASPLQDKRKILRAADRTGCGYYPVADRALAKTLGVDTPPDLQEAWVMTPEFIPNDPYYQNEMGHYFFAKNKWPKDVPGFRETVLEYFETMVVLSMKMMGVLALALDLNENFFANKIDKATNQFRLIRYPPQDATPEKHQLRAGAHTDYGALTILRSDDVPGTLQVKIPSGGWTDVRPPPHAFVCNIGDAMARWTGGRWNSTLHRVANPEPGSAPAETLSKGRISLVFFHQPNHDVVLAGIGETASTENPITMGDHHRQKIHAAVDTTPPAD